MSERGSSLDAEQLESTLGVLASQRRLRALVALRQRGTRLSVSTLADEVAVREFDATIDELSSETLLRVYNSLYHVHLPKLRDAGVVEYDPDAGTVELADDADDVERIIDSVFDA
jgi:DNA-binding transcriptional ArsR family regulator